MTSADLSYIKGEINPPLLKFTVGEILEHAAAHWPETEALVSVEQTIRWTYSQLNYRVNCIAAGLLSLGLMPGDRIGIWAPNCAEWLLVQFATARVGLVLVNINPAYRLAELEYALNKVGVKAVIAAQSFKSSDYVGMLESLAPEIAQYPSAELQAIRLPQLRTVIKIGGDARRGWLQFDAIHSNDHAAVRAVAVNVEQAQPINIQFTSGTTGSPKGAMLSHRNIVNNAYLVGRNMGLRAGDRLCVPVPLYHCFGMVMSNLACAIHGATVVYPAAGFDPLAVLKTIQSERCTALHGVPTMFIAELEHPDFYQFDLSSLRAGIMAGSPCPIEVMRRVVERMHMREVTIAYGMTETSPVSFQSSIEDSLERRVSTVGKILPHTECKIIDEQGRILPRGEIGEICTRGYAVMLGYWGDIERTADAIDTEGWMHTGDLGAIDAEGYCNIVGRSKDMIIRGGENIYPREVEEFLFRHPKVADVTVVGVPDEKYGEEICAWIRLCDGITATEQEIIDYCRNQIAHYKVPRHVRFVHTFPTTVTGKIQKYLIRKMMISELRLCEQRTA